MDDNSQFGSLVKWGAGALGLSAVLAAVASPKLGLWIAVVLGIILLLALVLFGGYYVWSRLKASRRREHFSSAIQAQTAEAPVSISDPNKRAALDKVRQKFQSGLQEFKSRGKDIYKLPWFVIIGESGSGKTEAIRHSGIDFPPGLQNELQGAGGTVNMDWWFTNRGIILDTAGSMIFNEAQAGETPEWREFLKLLKKARAHSPINGLFLVLSVESLIKDSADRISQKAGKLAQQLDLIQRTLDIRFPVYLLITKSDLLTGFREFSDSIDDPLLQGQMFGWSNPDPLDSGFRPDLVEQHLQLLAERVRRRRLAVLRDSFTAGQSFTTETTHFTRTAMGPRRLDHVDTMYALPESILRLAPRLRRYLEIIFVAGEWSAKPVFLRGIYFTSSMREGKALDEAIAFATGLTLDQLPEDRRWDRDRAFFLRDLLHEKVFRESGLVTRATNTLKLLRKRQLVIFGTASLALIILAVFAFLGARNLKESVSLESDLWVAGANNWNSQGLWYEIVTNAGAATYSYAGASPVPVGNKQESLTQYHRQLERRVEGDLAVDWIFRPMAWMGFADIKHRQEAQRSLFEASVVIPLVQQTRTKMIVAGPPAQTEGAIRRQKEALLSLIQIEADARRGGDITLPDGPSGAMNYLTNFLSYLTDHDVTATPELSELADTFASTYSAPLLGKNGGAWPPKRLEGSDVLSTNVAIDTGLNNFQVASQKAQKTRSQNLQQVDDFADKLKDYYVEEISWMTNRQGNCVDYLEQAKAKVDSSWNKLTGPSGFPVAAMTNLSSCYARLADESSAASASTLQDRVRAIRLRLALNNQKLFTEIAQRLNDLASQAKSSILSHRDARAYFMDLLDGNCLGWSSGSAPDYQTRWMIYTNACALASAPLKVDSTSVGDKWARLLRFKANSSQFRDTLAKYKGPLASYVSASCSQIAEEALGHSEENYLGEYINLASKDLANLSNQSYQDASSFTNARAWLANLEGDLQSSALLGDKADTLSSLAGSEAGAKQKILQHINDQVTRKAGFPVILTSTSPMDLRAIGELRSYLASVTAELRNPVWQADKTGALIALAAKCDDYSKVVNSLVKSDGSAAQWQLSFVPPGSDEINNKEVAETYRNLGVSSAGKPLAWTDVGGKTSDAGPLIPVESKLDADAGLTLRIRAFRDQATQDSEVFKAIFPDWGLVRLIEDPELKAERVSGTRWRFNLTRKYTVMVAGKAESKIGNEIFEADLLDGSLPTIEEWDRNN